jgi:hypothetical protein
MPPLTAARLIEMLAGYVHEKGKDLPVTFYLYGKPTPIVRAWWDEDNQTIMLHME